MSNHLPIELVDEILTRLPVKSLLRFQCVSKSWRTRISNPDFVHNHMQLSAKQTPYKVFFGKNFNSFEIHLEKELPWSPNLGSGTILKLPPCQSRYLNLKFVGSCHGVICVAFDGKLILWNPSIRRKITFPYSQVSPPCNYKIFGYGFDPVNNNHKVVSLSYYDRCMDLTPYRIEVYSVNAGVWTEIHPRGNLSGTIIIATALASLVKGALHWWVEHGLPRKQMHSSIIRVHLSTEVSDTLMLPEPMEENVRNAEHSRLAVVWESLALIVNGSSSCCIWVMSGYDGMNVGSWSLAYLLENQGIQFVYRVLGLRSNGNILLLGDASSGTGKIVYYDPVTREYMTSSSQSSMSTSVEMYAESLALLNNGTPY